MKDAAAASYRWGWNLVEATLLASHIPRFARLILAHERISRIVMTLLDHTTRVAMAMRSEE